MNLNDLEKGGFFTTDGKDVWKLRFFYRGPSCELENLETGKTENFGLGGLTAQNFHRIEMPEILQNGRH